MLTRMYQGLGISLTRGVLSKQSAIENSRSKTFMNWFDEIEPATDGAGKSA